MSGDGTSGTEKKWLLKKLGSNLVFFQNLTFMEQLGEDQLLFVKEI